MKISLLVPTLRRPQRVRVFLNSVRQTLANKETTEILFLIDTDDAVTDDTNIAKEYSDLNIKFFRHEPAAINGVRYNFLCTQAQGEVLMYSGDDFKFLTSDWDTFVINHYESIPDRISLLAPFVINKHNRRTAVTGFMSRRHYEIIGKFFTEYFYQWCDDKWLSKVYQSIGRYHITDAIQIVHEHYLYNKKLLDTTYSKYHKLIPIAQKVYDKKRGEIGVWAEQLRRHLV